MSVLGWIVSGVAAAWLMGWIMPVDNNPLKSRAAVGLVAATVGGAVATVWTHSHLVALNMDSVFVSALAALYALFAYQCFSIRRPNAS